MKSIRIMSIIGISWAAFCFVMICACMTYPADYEASSGWGVFAIVYLLAFSIVALVQNNKRSSNQLK